MEKRKEIKIFSDFACPFCYIGFSIAEKLKSQRKDLDFKFIPLILNPDETIEGSDLYEHIDEATILAGYERIEKLAEEYGLVYNNKRKRFSTNRLHAAGFYAEENSRYFEFAKLAFKYIFEYGENVGKKETVDEIAQLAGLDVEEMNNKIDSGFYNEKFIEAESLADDFNIESVPTFIVENKKKPTQLKEYNDFIKDLLD